MAIHRPIMLTINQVAERLNLPTHFIRKLCWEDKIIYVMAGSKYLINYRKLVDYLNGENEYSAPDQIADAQ